MWHLTVAAGGGSLDPTLPPVCIEDTRVQDNKGPERRVYVWGRGGYSASYWPKLLPEASLSRSLSLSVYPSLGDFVGASAASSWGRKWKIDSQRRAFSSIRFLAAWC